jgi:signal peptide peptidase SppA
MRLIDIVSAPWAITPDMFAEVQGAYARHMRGEKIDVSTVEARIGVPLKNARRDLQVENGVAVIALEGVLAKRMNLFMEISGGTSMQIAASQFRAAMDDPGIKAIVLHVDSPGGTVDGTQELADLVYAARDVKPVFAVADGSMQSAAYWIGSAAERVFISSDTTLVGSIGVVATHVDRSRLEKNAGIDKVEITAGRYKRMETESGTLTREGRSALQASVDQVYEIFVDAVGRNRGKAADDVHANMADGRTFIGKKAIEAGLVDGVATLSKAIETAAAFAANQSLTAIDGVSKTVTQPNEEAQMDVTKLRKEHPEVAKALVDEGHAAGRTEGLAAGKAEGIVEGSKTERDRIKAVEAQSLPGHETLIGELKFDGKTTGEQAAVKILQAERAKGDQRLNNMRDDAKGARTNATDPPADKKLDDQKAVDPQALATKAQAYQAEQAKLGNKVSAADAVAHVMAKK